MGKLLRALIVEDSQDDAELLLQKLRRGGYKPTFERVATPEAMRAALNRQTWDIVFADHSMPHFNGTTALALLKEKGLDLPFIFMSGTIGEDVAVAAMKAGANDYIMKGNLKRLVPAVERELREADVRKERKRVEETIQHMAYYDPLTDLPNRTLFHDRLQQAIFTAQRENKSVALLLIDLDRFKEINDTLGHYCGDLVLQQMGPRLRGVLRECDTIARFAGDEFAMVLPSTNSEGATQVAQKILKVLEPPFKIENLPIVVEASIGIALCPDHSTNADNLIQRADVAMYVAKEAGSGYAVYIPNRDQRSPPRLALMGELRHAIDHGQLFLHYQPKIDLRTGRVAGVEALVRWQHPEYGFIPPDDFIAPAERTGLIKPLTLWVLHTALRQCRAWHQVEFPISMSVNLSARNLQDPEFSDQIAGLLENSGVAPTDLELEITESAIMSGPGHAMGILTRLRQMGIGLSIDDFGTGYSSLGHLKKLPVDEIKIDKSFVKDMVMDGDDAVIVRSTIDLAHHLGLKVVAEGVESREIFERLVELGCDAAQGYYMSRPLPADELAHWLSEKPPTLLRNRR